MARPRKTTKPPKEWPLIRVLKRKGGRVAYQVDTRSLNGKQPKFKTLEHAETHAASMRRELANSGLEAFNITTAQREDAKKALDLLAAARLSGVRLEQAAEFYLLHHRPEAGEITLSDLRDRFLENRRSDGVKEVTIKGYVGRLKQFVNALGAGKPVSEITETEVRTYLERRGISDQNRRNDYAALWSLFEFAKRPRDYHGRDTKPDAPLTGWIARNPLLSIRRAKVAERKPEIIKAEAAAALLRAAYETRELPSEQPDPNRIGLLAHIVLKLFAGVRPEAEMPHLNWSHLELHRKKGVLNVIDSKNRAGARHINLPPAAVEWLRLCPQGEGPIHIARNYRRRWERLKKLAGIEEWKQDILRHTYASVHYRLGQDAARTRAQLGHAKTETGTLFVHYRVLMTEAEAKKILSLTPKAVLGTPDNIVSIHDHQKPKSQTSRVEPIQSGVKRVRGRR